MPQSFDVIVVGARCAGAALAAQLADAGVRVLMLDSDSLPSDMVMSTHLLQPPGVEVLDALGVGAQLRAAVPASRRFRFGLEDAYLLADLGDAPGYCVRRDRLDTWLQTAAVERGVELRDRTRVVELLREGDRVAGVVAESAEGRYTLRAPLVVGADGRHSIVARLTEVEEYLAFDGTRGGFWFYWPTPAIWHSADYPFDWMLNHFGDEVLYVFQTNDDQLLIAVMTSTATARSWGSQYRQHYLNWLAANPISAPLVRDNAPLGQGMGMRKARFFFRRPVGPGFALVGDAGTCKDYSTGHGMADALLSARELCRAILDGRPEAFEYYWRQRDVSLLPLYFDAKLQGEVGTNNALMRLVIGNLGRTPQLAQHIAEQLHRTRDPIDIVERWRAACWLAAAAARGEFDVFSPLPSLVRHGRAYRRERAQRRQLLVQAQRALDGANQRQSRGHQLPAQTEPAPREPSTLPHIVE